MKNSLILLICMAAICSCGTQKVSCKNPGYFYLIFSAYTSHNAGGSSVSGDSAVHLRMFAKNGTFSTPVADTVMIIDTYSLNRAVRISDAFSNFADGDFEVLLLPSQTKYAVTNITAHPKTKRIANRDRGNPAGECYNDLSLQINGKMYRSNALSAAYINVA